MGTQASTALGMIDTVGSGLRLEFVAQDDSHSHADSACTPSASSTHATLERTPLVDGLEDLGTEQQALPFPGGAPAYLGWIEHPDLGGCMRIQLSASRSRHRWQGILEFGRPSGLRERVQVVPMNEGRCFMCSTTGRECTELHGKAASSGTLSGSVVHDGVRGGRFVLWPRACGAYAQKLQEIYVAWRSGRCVEIFPHEPSMELPSECSICLDSFAPGDVIARTWCSKQGHVFHRCCARDWLKSRRTCPLCRRSLLALSWLFDEPHHSDYGGFSYVLR